MACNQSAKPGIHNCRCAEGRSECFWHGVPVTSVRATFRDLIVAAYEDPEAEDTSVRYADLIRLAEVARAAMLDKVPGTLPLDDRKQSTIDYFTTLGRYGKPAV